MVSRIKKTLTVRERMAVFEHTNQVAKTTSDDEREALSEKSERLRRLRFEAKPEDRGV